MRFGLQIKTHEIRSKGSTDVDAAAFAPADCQAVWASCDGRVSASRPHEHPMWMADDAPHVVLKDQAALEMPTTRLSY